MVRKYVYKKKGIGTSLARSKHKANLYFFDAKELLRISGETLEALKIHAARTDAA